MDLLRTILIYMSMIFMSSVQSAPGPDEVAELLKPIETPYVQTAETPGPTDTPAPTQKPSPVPTIDIEPNKSYKLLSIGDKGDKVKDLQAKLAEYGYLEGEVDGAYGNQTRRAVEKFQYNHGLSVDGIAGKNTLTVLYDSDQVRPNQTPSPSPSQTPPSGKDQLSPALPDPDAGTKGTEEPEAGQADIPEPDETLPASTETASAAQLTAAKAQPSDSIAPTETPAAKAQPSESTAPTETPAPQFLPMQDYVIMLPGMEEPMLSVSEDSGEAHAIVPYAYGEKIYLPLFEILTQSGGNIIISDDLEMDEYAFAQNDTIYRITVKEGKDGQPIEPQGFRDNETVLRAFSDVKSVEEMLYFPLEDIQSFMNISFVTNDTQKSITLMMPKAEE